MATFILNILFFSLLTWYFDHVDDSNRGKKYEKLFFLEKSYWFQGSSIIKTNILNSSLSKEQTNIINNITEDKGEESKNWKNQETSIGKVTVSREKDRVLNGIDKGKSNLGLRVEGISKEYIQTNCCKKTVVDALKPV